MKSIALKNRRLEYLTKENRRLNRLIVARDKKIAELKSLLPKPKKPEPKVKELCPKCGREVIGTGVKRRCINMQCTVVLLHIDVVKKVTTL